MKWAASALLSFLILDLKANAEAFRVIWNVPSKKCNDLDPNDYGIDANIDLSFHGDKIVTFYESFGLFPYCKSDIGSDGILRCDPVNGGVPQAANITAHLEKAKIDIENAIPNSTFDGYAVIDYEAWRPLYDLNWSSRHIYRKYSMDLVKREYGYVEGSTLQYLARYQFDEGAKKFFLATIELGKQMRPHAKWGFWEFPLCDYQAGYAQPTCLKHYDIINEQLAYILQASNVVYPSIYYYGYEPDHGRLLHAYARLDQTRSWVQRHNRDIAIVPFVKIEYSPSDSDTSTFYNKSDLCASLKYPMESGVPAVIVWSSSYRMSQRCDGLKEYMATQLSPFVNEVKRRADKCALKYCSGNGRCYTPDLTPPDQCELATNPADISCQCDPGFAGTACDKKADTLDNATLFH